MPRSSWPPPDWASMQTHPPPAEERTHSFTAVFIHLTIFHIIIGVYFLLSTLAGRNVLIVWTEMSTLIV